MLGDRQVREVLSYTYLGIPLSQELAWNGNLHLDYVKPKKGATRRSGQSALILPVKEEGGGH